MFSSAHLAIKLSGRDEPSRKLKAEREWSSMYIGRSGHRVISDQFIRWPDHPTAFSRSFLPAAIARTPGRGPGDTTQSPFSPVQQCPTRRVPRNPAPTSRRKSARDLLPTTLRLHFGFVGWKKCET